MKGNLTSGGLTSSTTTTTTTQMEKKDKSHLTLDFEGFRTKNPVHWETQLKYLEEEDLQRLFEARMNSLKSLMEAEMRRELEEERRKEEEANTSSGRGAKTSSTEGTPKDSVNKRQDTKKDTHVNNPQDNKRNGPDGVDPFTGFKEVNIIVTDETPYYQEGILEPKVVWIPDFDGYLQFPEAFWNRYGFLTLVFGFQALYIICAPHLAPDVGFMKVEVDHNAVPPIYYALAMLILVVLLFWFMCFPYIYLIRVALLAFLMQFIIVSLIDLAYAFACGIDGICNFQGFGFMLLRDATIMLSVYGIIRKRWPKSAIHVSTSYYENELFTPSDVSDI